MSYTKRQLAEAAFTELGIADYVFDLSPEMIENAVARMDAMASNWAASGINIQYPLQNTATPTENLELLVPMGATLALILNLACQLGPSLGKLVAPETKANASIAYEMLLTNRMQPIPQMSLPGTMPIGAGNKLWGAISYPFFGSFYYWRNNPLPNGQP